MANVHGFRDLSNPNPNPRQNRPQAGYNFMGGNSATANNDQNQGPDDENLNIPFMSNLSFKN